ncbi:MAG: class I tRNA ligase family protein [Polyangiales bacterium]
MTRGWFYSLMMISTLLFEKQGYPHPFKNCVVLGLLTDEKGLKYSKSLKNYTDPLKLMTTSAATRCATGALHEYRPVRTRVSSKARCATRRASSC